MAFSKEKLCVFFSECLEERHFSVSIIYMKKFHHFSGLLDVQQLHFSICFDFHFDMDLEKIGSLNATHFCVFSVPSPSLTLKGSFEATTSRAPTFSQADLAESSSCPTFAAEFCSKPPIRRPGLGLERTGWFRFLVTSFQSQQSGILWVPWQVIHGCKQVGGFKYCLFSPLFGEIIQFDKYVSKGLVQPPTSNRKDLRPPTSHMSQE